MFKFKSIIASSVMVLALMFTGIQTMSAQKVMDKMSDQACEQMKKLDKDLNAAEVEKAMEGIMVNVVMTNFGEISKEYGISMNDGEEAFMKLGEELAMKLATECPEFLVFAMTLAGEEDEGVDEAVYSNTVEGKFIGIEGDEFVYIKIEEENGRVKKLFWGEPFNGDNLLSDTKKLKGKKVVVSYTETECFNAKLKDYTTLKEVTSFEVK